MNDRARTPAFRRPGSRPAGVRARATAVLAALVVAGTLAVSGCGSSGGSSSGSLPDAKITPLAGGAAVSARSLTGPAVVNLWATWCGPCRTELPAFQQVHTALGDKVHIVGVNQGDSGDKAGSYLAQVGVDFPQYLDANGALSDAFKVTGLPASIVIDASGKVVEVHSGALTAEALTALITKDLGIG